MYFYNVFVLVNFFLNWNQIMVLRFVLYFLIITSYKLNNGKNRIAALKRLLWFKYILRIFTNKLFYFILQFAICIKFKTVFNSINNTYFIYNCYYLLLFLYNNTIINIYIIIVRINRNVLLLIKYYSIHYNE